MGLAQDLRYAFRLLLKDKWFTLVAVLALALGIGVNTTVFTFVNAVLIRGLPFEDAKEIMYVGTRNTVTGDDDSASYPEFDDWRRQTRAFAGLAAYRGGTMNLSDPERPPERVAGAYVSANAFGLLRQRTLLGRDFAPGEDGKGAAPVVILGYRVWKNRFDANPAIVGRTIKVNEVACTVVGVMPDGMRFAFNHDVWRPLVPDAELEQRDDRAIGVFGRLAPGVSREQAQSEMSTIARRLEQQYPDTNKQIDAQVMTFNERFNGGPIRLVFLSLLGAVGFVLLIACANVANLLLSRSIHRTREIAVRFALGASRARVVRQLLIESTLLACTGGVLGLALTWFGVRLFDSAVSNVNKPYWIVFSIDPWVFAYFAGICVATGVIFGLAPALQVSRANVNATLNEGGRGNAGTVRTRRLASVMVVGELALTLVLLTGAGLMVRSFLKLYALDLGIDSGRLLAMGAELSEEKYPGPEQQRAFFDALRSRLNAVPGVSRAAVVSNVPFGGSSGRVLDIDGRPAPSEERAQRVGTVLVSPEYFETLSLAMRQGRAFTESDGGPGAEVVVVNERFIARFLPGEEALGRRIRLREDRAHAQPAPWLTIVGISPNVRQGDQQSTEPDAVVYEPYRLRPSGAMSILVRADAPTSVITAVREAVRTVDPDQPVFNVQTMDELLALARWPYRVFGSMFAIFAVIGLVLSSVGIYAVMAYSVTQRTQEIGVRMALGAQPAQISWLVLRSGLWQLGIGLALGLLGGAGVSSLLESIVAQIPPTDPVTFVSITLLLAIVTLTACVIPARRATRLDPLVALRPD